MLLLNEIVAKINEMQHSFNLISEERKGLLKGFVEYISNKLQEGKGINLIFICTHNSRRSIMSQIWAQTAADYFMFQIYIVIQEEQKQQHLITVQWNQ